MTEVPVLDLASIAIATTSLRAETARYLCYRAFECWPEYHASDDSGDCFSHRGFWLPNAFTLTQTIAGGAQVHIAIAPNRVVLSLPGQAHEHVPAGRALMEHIADDPIWGPAWTVPVTRYYE